MNLDRLDPTFPIVHYVISGMIKHVSVVLCYSPGHKLGQYAKLFDWSLIMGLEKKCRVVLGTLESEGTAYCGDGDLSFKGDFRFAWKWKDLTELKVKGGVLTATFKGKIASFFLGDQTDKWLDAIMNPKGRLDKLGVKPGHRFAVLGKFGDGFLDELATKGARSGRGALDIAFVRLDCAKDLSKLLKVRAQIVQSGMVWAVWPKGRKEFREDDIREFALKNGLVDVKVASFSETLSALKLVIPLKSRKKAP